jgi:hypothetical protein
MLSPLEGGMPGPAFAPMVVLVRAHASSLLFRLLCCSSAAPQHTSSARALSLPLLRACMPRRQQRRALSLLLADSAACAAIAARACQGDMSCDGGTGMGLLSWWT